MGFEVRWKLCWENELQRADHIELAEFFQKTYGPTGEFNAKPFEGSRSWAGARPELRAIAYDSSGVAAHMGVLRRFIKVGALDLLVAELGLYGVRPDLERLGIGYSIQVLLPTLKELDVPFAFGTARHALQRHVERLGRDSPVTVLSGFRVPFHAARRSSRQAAHAYRRCTCHRSASGAVNLRLARRYDDRT